MSYDYEFLLFKIPTFVFIILSLSWLGHEHLQGIPGHWEEQNTLGRILEFCEAHFSGRMITLPATF